jgi:DNA-binding transcriptional ArsR family regulator
MAPAPLRVVAGAASEADAAETTLDAVFAALADPVRRSILTHLDGRALLVKEIAQRFEISLQAVSKHIQVLVRAGLVRQERTTAAVWLNRYSKYWQQQFDLLAATLADIDDRGRTAGRRPGGRRKRPQRRKAR